MVAATVVLGAGCVRFGGPNTAASFFCGGGLPPGFAVAIAEDDPDRMLYAACNRFYVSANGGVFWRSLPCELPDIDSVGWID